MGYVLPLDSVRTTLQTHGARLAYLFGSHAQNRARPGSDVDVAVLWPDGEAREWLRRNALLGLDLRTLVGAPVDVLDLNSAAPLIAFEAVCRGMPLVWDDLDERIRYEFRVRDRYEDFIHIQGFYARALQARLAR